MRQNKERVTAVQVLQFLISRNIVKVARNAQEFFENKYLSNAFRAVQRYLERKWFQRGRRTGTLKINPDHVVWILKFSPSETTGYYWLRTREWRCILMSNI